MELFHKLFPLLICVCSLILTVSSIQQRVMYTGYEAHRFVPNTEENLKILKDLQANNPGVIFFKQPGNKGSAVDILFPAHLQTDLLEALVGKMPSSLLSNDLESLMDHDSHVNRLETMDDGVFDFATFWNFKKIMDFYSQLEALHPDTVKLEQYGVSFENRPLMAISIADSHPVPANKSAMVIDGGTHAREWITVMSCAFFANELVNNKAQYQHIFNAGYVLLICSVNPDGFEYSWSTNRLWRKTRTTDGSFLSSCVGVDPNRNYKIGHKGGGSSTNKCDETYAGPEPFSIAETRALRDYFFTKNIVSYCSLHSYSQLILLSYGCRNMRSENIKEQRYPEFEQDLALANKAATTLKAIHGTEYQCGNSDEILYEACGTSADWMKGVYGTRWSYTYELRDTGTFGFILPADQVLPTCEETAAALKVMHEHIATELLKQNL